MFEAYSANNVVPKMPYEITSLACQKSSQSVLIGSKVGHLFVYTQSSARHRRAGNFDLDNMCKSFDKKAVQELTVCEREELLLNLSEGVLAARELVSPYKVLALLLKTKPVNSFLQWSHTNDEHGVMYLLVTSKKRFYMYKWSVVEKEFQEVAFDYNMSFVDNPVSLRYINGSVAFSVRDEYFLMKMSNITALSAETESWVGDVQRLFNHTDSVPTIPQIIELRDRNQIGFLKGKTLVLSNYDGMKTSNCVDIEFSDSPVSIVYDSPYLVALLSKSRIEVRSLNPPLLIQSLLLNKATFICAGNPGSVFVGSLFDVWLLDGYANLRKNVATLLDEKHFDLAIQLASSSNVFTEENKVEIKRQAAKNLFYQKKFEESFALHSEIKTDVFAIVQLFPELVPAISDKSKAAPSIEDFPENDKKRALLALGNYLSAVRADYAKRLDQLKRPKDGDETKKEEAKKLYLYLQVIDTTLLKCYLKTKPMLVDSLLRLHNNSCYFEDAENILKQENRLPSLFILYESRKKHEMALDLLRTQSMNPSAEPFFEGVDRTVEYLQTLGNNHLELIFRFAKWVFSKDLKSGLAIFTGEESDVARNLDRDSVLDFLRKECIAGVIPYLEHLIYKWEEPRAHFHEALVEHYVSKLKELFRGYVHALPDDENIIRAGEEQGPLGEYRKRLIKFLHFSLVYNPQAILLQLNNYAFYEERALLHGRLKQHEQALTIYTSILNDFEAAEEYCKIYYNENDEINCQVYLLLFRAYVCPFDPSVAGLSETEFPMPLPDVRNAIRVLSRHADHIDTVSALCLIPPETPLKTLSKALNAVLQTTHDDKTACALRRSICESAVEKGEIRRRAAESTRINVTNSSECCKCGKRIGNSAFAKYPADGSLAHLHCYNESSPNLSARTPS